MATVKSAQVSILPQDTFTFMRKEALSLLLTSTEGCVSREHLVCPRPPHTLTPHVTWKTCLPHMRRTQSNLTPMFTAEKEVTNKIFWFLLVKLETDMFSWIYKQLNIHTVNNVLGIQARPAARKSQASRVCQEQGCPIPSTDPHGPHTAGLRRWAPWARDDSEFKMWVVFKRTQAQCPAPTQQFTAIHNSSFRESNAFF